jgi:hypothetical protein
MAAKREAQEGSRSKDCPASWYSSTNHLLLQGSLIFDIVAECPALESNHQSSSAISNIAKRSCASFRSGSNVSAC